MISHENYEDHLFPVISINYMEKSNSIAEQRAFNFSDSKTFVMLADCSRNNDGNSTGCWHENANKQIRSLSTWWVLWSQHAGRLDMRRTGKMEFDFELYFNDQTNNTFNDVAQAHESGTRWAVIVDDVFFVREWRALTRATLQPSFIFYMYIFHCPAMWFTSQNGERQRLPRSVGRKKNWK